MDTQTFNAVFFSFVITSAIGCILGFTKMLYKSKCKEVNFCCIKIVRDIEGEIKEDELEIQNSRATRQEQEEKSNNNV